MEVSCSRMTATPSERVAKQSASSPVMVTATPTNGGQFSSNFAIEIASDRHSRHIANPALCDQPDECAAFKFAPPISSPTHGLTRFNGLGSDGFDKESVKESVKVGMNLRLAKWLCRSEAFSRKSSKRLACSRHSYRNDTLPRWPFDRPR